MVAPCLARYACTPSFLPSSAHRASRQQQPQCRNTDPSGGKQAEGRCCQFAPPGPCLLCSSAHVHTQTWGALENPKRAESQHLPQLEKVARLAKRSTFHVPKEWGEHQPCLITLSLPRGKDQADPAFASPSPLLLGLILGRSHSSCPLPTFSLLWISFATYTCREKTQ